MNKNANIYVDKVRKGYGRSILADLGSSKYFIKARQLGKSFAMANAMIYHNLQHPVKSRNSLIIEDIQYMVEEIGEQ